MIASICYETFDDIGQALRCVLSYNEDSDISLPKKENCNRQNTSEHIHAPITCDAHNRDTYEAEAINTPCLFALVN